MDNYTWNISVSLNHYPNKNTLNWGGVRYHKQSVTIDDFIDRIKQGYCFCYCFNDRDESFGQKEKTKGNYSYTNIIVIDIDESPISMTDYIEQLTLIPTVAYTTPNNLIVDEKHNGSYRFRICYCFKNKITSEQEYTAYYDTITQQLSQDVPTVQVDTCTRSCNQQFFGSKSDCDIYDSRVIYSSHDFPFQNINVFSSFFSFGNGKNKDGIKTSKTERTSAQTKDLIKPPKPKKTFEERGISVRDDKFMQDVEALSTYDLLTKYEATYPYICHSPLNFRDGYALIDRDYLEIKRKWRIVLSDEQKTQRTCIVRDGQGRRKRLFNTALVLRKIKNDLTYEHLLYILIYERQYYYDNRDRVLTNKCLMDIATNAMTIPMESIKIQGNDKRRFKVDKSYCAEQGISANTMKNIVRKKLKDEEIGNLYDCSISLNENLTALREAGIKVGKSKLYAWCRENNINPKGK